MNCREYKREELPQYLQNDLEVLVSGKSQYLPEVICTRPGESPLTFEVFKIPYIVSGSEEPAVLGIALDITDRKPSRRSPARK